MAKGLRVLITNIAMAGRSGTEIVTRNLAVGLVRRGHTPVIYSPQLGAIAGELRQIGVSVVSSIDKIRETPDIIHGHHSVQAGIAAARFPETPALFVCHDFVAWHDSPPRLPSFVRFVGVGDATLDRLTMEEGVCPVAACIIENGVDIERFCAGATPPPVPRKAIAFVKSREQIEPLASACAMRGIELELAGSIVGRTLAAPEEVMPGFDLVFASGMTAIEALACLRPVVVCDGRGLAGFVDAVRYPAWRRQNFGLRTLVQPLTPERIAAEIDRYDAQVAVAVGERIRKEAALDAWIPRYESLYSECLTDFAQRRHEVLASPAQVASHMESWSTACSALWQRERVLLHETITTLQAGLLPLVPGERVAVADARRLALRNFHDLESWGAWSAKPDCGVIFRCAGDPGELSVRIEYVPLQLPNRSRFEVTCMLNGEVAANWVDEPGPEGPRTRVLALGADRGDSGVVFLSFRTSEPVSPASAGLSIDNRPLGLGLVALTVVANAAAALGKAVAPLLSTAYQPKTPDLQTPSLSVVVLSHEAPPTLPAAVRSALRQVEATEVVVVNSGGGDAAALLARAGLNVRVVESERDLLPGGARNAGIGLTTGRYVAFLADDCTAEPGWAAARLAAHGAGAAAVASALICHRPRHPVAVAAHLSLFVRRMPLVPPALALAYGASYDRRLFTLHGGFREDLRGGEDTEFHLRLPARDKPVWSPAVRARHFGPSTLVAFVRDQYQRGRRAAESFRSINGLNKWGFAKCVVQRTGLVLRLSPRVVPASERMAALLALPLIVMGALVYICGALSDGQTVAPVPPKDSRQGEPA